MEKSVTSPVCSYLTGRATHPHRHSISRHGCSSHTTPTANTHTRAFTPLSSFTRHRADILVTELADALPVMPILLPLSETHPVRLMASPSLAMCHLLVHAYSSQRISSLRNSPVCFSLMYAPGLLSVTHDITLLNNRHLVMWFS